MNLFNRIVVTGPLNTTEDLEDRLKKYTKTAITFPTTHPSSDQETLERIGDADAILVSWESQITKNVLEKLPHLRYIGICATNMDNVDVVFAQSKGIAVTNVEHYGDEATAEFIFALLLDLVKGFGEYQWREYPAELLGKTIGIVGMGAIGMQVLRLAKGFGMKVIYTSKTRKSDIESKDVQFTSLDDLIKNSDIVTLQVPKNTEIFTVHEFELMRSGKILINTCLGKVFSIENFMEWINRRQNYAIFDRYSSSDYYESLKDIKNIIFSKPTNGLLVETRERLTKRVIENIDSYLQDQ
jgi:lactate dehydrogenase-like 2-hydroxyacid dehydrogenase